MNASRSLNAEFDAGALDNTVKHIRPDWIQSTLRFDVTDRSTLLNGVNGYNIDEAPAQITHAHLLGIRR